MTAEADLPLALERTTGRVLVVRPGGISSLLTAVPAMRSLRRHMPNHRIELACRPELAGLARATHAVDSVRDIGTIRSGFREARNSEAQDLDIAVNMTGCEAPPVRGIRTISYATAEQAGPPWRDDEHEMDRWCRLITYATGRDADPFDLHLATFAQPRTDLIIVHPGAKQSFQRWQADRMASVARMLSARGYRVIITGSRAEHGLAATVTRAAGLPAEANYAGRTSIVQLAGLVARARLVITPDTSMNHLATATSTPSVVLFGPSDPRQWGPRRGPHTALRAQTGRMQDLTISHVMSAAELSLYCNA